MASYVLIESRDPFEIYDVRRTYDIAANLVKDANSVTLFLVENGVFAARESSGSEALASLAARGVSILADAFSLRERGIHADRLVPQVAPASVEDIVDHLAQEHFVLWH